MASVWKREAEKVVFAEVLPNVVETCDMDFAMRRNEAETGNGMTTGATQIVLPPGSIVAEWWSMAMLSKYDAIIIPALMVDPAVLIVTPLKPTRLEVPGALITIWLAFVPESVRFRPDRPMVDPDAVVFPAVFAPRRLCQLFSAAAPGAATESERLRPTLLCVIEPEIFAPLKVVPVPA